jgi:hypothetical protein
MYVLILVVFLDASGVRLQWPACCDNGRQRQRRNRLHHNGPFVRRLDGWQGR